MAFSIRDLKRRMKSVKNTGQITRAMEAVSATKMRRAQAVALAARPYAQKALELLNRLSEKAGETYKHWLLESRPVEKTAVVLVTSDKGLCGVLNANVLRVFEKFMLSFPRRRESRSLRINPRVKLESDNMIDIITIGRYGTNYAYRHGNTIAQEYAGVGDVAHIQESRPVSKFILDAYKHKRYDAVYAIYTNFISTLKQKAVVRKILPLTKKGIESLVEGMPALATRYKIQDTRYSFEYTLEPNPEEILHTLLPALVEVNLYHILLESNASEHSARMLAMKNASDNAKELLSELQLSYNKARQAGITREIAEITGGAAALEA